MRAVMARHPQRSQITGFETDALVEVLCEFGRPITPTERQAALIVTHYFTAIVVDLQSELLEVRRMAG